MVTHAEATQARRSTDTMKAAVFVEPGRIELQEKPVPEIGPDEVLVVSDLKADPRFASNPLVAGDPHLRFYAGVPLQNREGHNLGT